MKRTMRFAAPIAAILLTLTTATAQVDSVSTSTSEIDPSKPTNLYTTINTSLEYSTGDVFEEVGVRISGQYAFNASNLLLFEVPVQRELNNGATGIGNIRLRYFGVLYKDYTRVFPKVAVVAPAVDIYLPGAKADKGIGYGSISTTTGIATGFFFSEKVQAYPIISYLYISKYTNMNLPDGYIPAVSGLNFQCITSWSISDRFFLQFNPAYSIDNLKTGSASFLTEFVLGYQPTERSNITLYGKEEFSIHQRTANIGYTFYF